MEFETLTSLLGTDLSTGVATGSSFSAPPTPVPFVAPPLHFAEPDALEQPILLIDAPAAVGKTTAARYLAASAGAPYLDLAEIPVGSDSLRGMLDGSGVLDHFRTGGVSIIVDALDEGFIRSGVAAFEAFLVTSAQLIGDLADSWEEAKPRLVMLGRGDSILWARAALESAGVPFGDCKIEFFDLESATEVVFQYALIESPSLHPEPVAAATDQFFLATARALGLKPDALWLDVDGRTFAGFAPVLAAVGLVLSENPKRSEEQWRAASGSARAWTVLRDTVWDLLVREREKVVLKLADGGSDLPEYAYSPEHQLRLLGHRLAGHLFQPLDGVEIDDAVVEEEFATAVASQFEVHPFLTAEKSTVFESLVCGYTAANAGDLQGASEILARCSRQPFLWRFLQDHIVQEAAVNGEVLGWFLASLWAESDTAPFVAIEEQNDQIVARVVSRTDSFECAVDGILALRGVGQQLSVDLPAREVHLLPSGRGTDTLFRSSSDLSISASSVHVGVSEVLLEDGPARVELTAEHLVGTTVEITRRDDVRLEVGGGFNAFPWRQKATGVLPEHGLELKGEDPVAQFLEFCADKLPTGGRPLVLDGKGRHLPTDGALGSWSPHYADALAVLVKLLTSRGVVSRDPLQTDDPTPAFHYRPTGFAWDELDLLFAQTNDPVRSRIWDRVRRELPAST